MPECDIEKENEDLIALMYVSTAFGLFTSLCFALLFAHKWFTAIDKIERGKLVPRLCAVIITLLTVERGLRLFEIYTWYYFPKFLWTMLYTINNFIAVAGIICSILVLLTLKLFKSFQNTRYSLDHQKRMYYGIIFADFITMESFFILNGIRDVYESEIGQIAMIMLAMVILVLSVVILMKINTEFVSRLAVIVAANASTCSTSSANTSTHPRTYTLSTMQSKSHNQGVQMVTHNVTDFDTDNTHTMNNIENEPMSDDEDNNEDVNKARSDTLKDVDPTVLSQKNSRRISRYGKQNQQILRTAAKSTVSSLWITFSFVLIFFASVLFSLEPECANIPSILGHILIAISFPIIGVSLTLTLPSSKNEYKKMCSFCDKWLVSVVTANTSKQIMNLSTAQESTYIE